MEILKRIVLLQRLESHSFTEQVKKKHDEDYEKQSRDAHQIVIR